MSRSTELAWLVVAASVTAPNVASADEQSGPPEPLRFSVEPLVFPRTDVAQTIEVTERRVTLQADVLFGFGSARLSRQARTSIAAAVSALRENHARGVRVVGYTDARGTASLNLVLSRRRAAAVARALRDRLGPGGPPLSIEGRGEANPVAANVTEKGADSPRGRARNRRVELNLG